MVHDIHLISCACAHTHGLQDQKLLLHVICNGFMKMLMHQLLLIMQMDLAMFELQKNSTLECD